MCQVTKRSIVSEHYDELVFNEPSESFARLLLNPVPVTRPHRASGEVHYSPARNYPEIEKQQLELFNDAKLIVSKVRFVFFVVVSPSPVLSTFRGSTIPLSPSARVPSVVLAGGYEAATALQHGRRGCKADASGDFATRGGAFAASLNGTTVDR